MFDISVFSSFEFVFVALLDITRSTDLATSRFAASPLAGLREGAAGHG
jgi:hypothetical protein